MIFVVKAETPRVKQVVNVTKFPGGEVGVNINGNFRESQRAFIIAHLTCSDDVMALLLTVDAIRQQKPNITLLLQLAYVPYARQDRVCNPGEALSIRVFANLINSLNFSEVLIFDPHSDVTPALIKNSTVVSAGDIFGHINFGGKWIVAPDAGAAKRCEAFAKRVGAEGVIQCVKHRETTTGKLSGFRALDDVEGKRLVVVDDILDGGRTFIGLSAVLEGAQSKELVVTHGIFSAGVEELVKHYDKIYTTNSFWGEVPENLLHEKIEWDCSW
jgi:ribose-phosphate pyrophosphokinase